MSMYRYRIIYFILFIYIYLVTLNLSLFTKLILPLSVDVNSYNDDLTYIYNIIYINYKLNIRMAILWDNKKIGIVLRV
jgi:hypothetical protein